jgi:hypothetical protein
MVEPSNQGLLTMIIGALLVLTWLVLLLRYPAKALPISGRRVRPGAGGAGVAWQDNREARNWRAWTCA